MHTSTRVKHPGTGACKKKKIHGHSSTKTGFNCPVKKKKKSQECLQLAEC